MLTLNITMGLSFSDKLFFLGGILVIKKYYNKETILYLVFGILTTLIDWITYAVFRHMDIDYKIATILSQLIAIIFAYISNKLWVFNSLNFRPLYLLKEFSSFISCRLITSFLTYLGMILMVDGIGIRNDMLCKVMVSIISLIMNYLFSKFLIFRKTKS